MVLSRLETLYRWINNLSPNVKTIIIIVLSIVVLETSFSGHTKLILQDYTE
jgi:hypothetical protein|nr:MAG TPA: hypothetical protein [Bacteriophage sp.]